MLRMTLWPLWPARRRTGGRVVGRLYPTVSATRVGRDSGSQAA